MYKVIKYCSEDIDGIQFVLSSLIDEDGKFFGTSFVCRRNGGISYDFIWDNGKWLLDEFYPTIKKAVETGVNLYDLKPDWFDDNDIENDGEPEMLKDEVFYDDILQMFEMTIKDGIFNTKF